MAKRKVVEDSGDDNFFANLAKSSGGDILNDIDSVSYYVDTGSLALNYIFSGKFIGGGAPGGKLIEIYGHNSSCKTLIGMNILHGCQRAGGIAVLMDCENSANKEFIKSASHCDVKKLVKYNPPHLKAVFDKMYAVMHYVRQHKSNDVPLVFLWDSIGVSPSERELNEVQLPEKYTKEQYKKIVGGKEQPGERAKICSAEFRKLNTEMAKYNATVIILNQVRDKIGTFAPMGMQPKTTAGGGNALPFYCSSRLETKTLKKIEEKITAKKNKILGINVKLKNMKNKVHRPFIESDNIELLFDRGINPLSGLLICLMLEKRIESKTGGNFVVKEEYADGKEVKFKASLDRNDMPLDILLQCPKLIDASSPEEVTEYLAPFMDAINFVPDENIEVIDVASEEDFEFDEDLDEDA